MLEKDIENLIAAHPKEFFPREEFKLVAQQHPIKKRSEAYSPEKHLGKSSSTTGC